MKREILLFLCLSLIFILLGIVGNGRVRGNEVLIVCSLLALMALLTVGFIFLKKTPWRELWNQSAAYLLLIFLMLAFALLFSNRILAGRWKILRLLGYLTFLYLLLQLFVVAVVRRKKELKTWKGNLGTGAFALCLLFILLEIVFLFRIRSHGSYPDSYGNINWYRKYWAPVNSLGHRGGEPEAGKRKVLVLGDSFAAGWGVDRAEDRFPELLGEMFSDSIQVINLGMPGSNTRGEFRRLKESGILPEVLILAYVLNDVQEAADDFGKIYPWKDPKQQYPFFLRPFLHYSTFLNFLLAERGYGMDQSNYVDYLKSCYDDPRILKKHKEDLAAISNWAEERNIPMLTLVFPLIQDLKGSKELLESFSPWQSEKGLVKMLDFEDLPADSIGVHPLDPHPSKLVHQKTAEFLYDFVQESLNQ